MKIAKTQQRARPSLAENVNGTLMENDVKLFDADMISYDFKSTLISDAIKGFKRATCLIFDVNLRTGSCAHIIHNKADMFRQD